jgi:hypothetical protein
MWNAVYNTVVLLARSESLASHMSAATVPVAAAVPAELLAREVASLPASCLLTGTTGFSVYLAAAPDIPLAIQEIGRLREITFRAAGEGTGAARDIDRFDSHYLHLLLWKKEKREIRNSGSFWPQGTLHRLYMGKEQAQRFFDWHLQPHPRVA